MKQPIEMTPQDLVATGAATPGVLPAGTPLSPTLPVLKPDQAGVVPTIEGTDAAPHNEHVPFGEAETGVQGAGLPLPPEGTDPAGPAPVLATGAIRTEYVNPHDERPKRIEWKPNAAGVLLALGLLLLFMTGRRA